MTNKDHDLEDRSVQKHQFFLLPQWNLPYHWAKDLGLQHLNTVHLMNSWTCVHRNRHHKCQVSQTIDCLLHPLPLQCFMTEPDPILCSSPPLLDYPLHSPLWIISEQQSPFYGHLLLEIFSFPFLSSESFQGVVYLFFFTSCICQDQKVGLDSLSKSFATWKSSLCFYWSC